MKNKIIGFGLILLGLLIVALLTTEVLTNIKRNYEKPDTTITVHNGKTDTIITKKKLNLY